MRNSYRFFLISVVLVVSFGAVYERFTSYSQIRTLGDMQITAGLSHSCAILTNGNVKCWGYNANGELGLGNTTNRGTTSGDMGANLPVIDLGSGSDGKNYTAKSLSAGDSHTCAILNDNSLKCWGLNASGQLGIGNLLSKGDASNEMGNNLSKVNLGTGKTAKFVSAGVAHTCAILNDNTLKCWGANASGQLGYGNDVDLKAPKASSIAFETGRTVTAVSAGIAHTCVILDDNSVHCWGKNASGQLGLENTTTLNAPSSTAVKLGTGLTAAKISSRGDHSCVILNNGSAKCWGNNINGQLGQNTDNSLLTTIGALSDQMGDNLPAIYLGDGRTALAITTSNANNAGDLLYGNTCVILDDYTVKCWGANAFFQLGRGTGSPTTDSTGVVAGQMTNLLPISLGTGLNARQIALGGMHVCTVLGSYTVKCWGWGGRGQLGQESWINRGYSMMGDNLLGTNLSEPLAVAATAVSFLLTTTATASKLPIPSKTPTRAKSPTRIPSKTPTRAKSPTRKRILVYPSMPSATRTATRTRTVTRTLSPTITVSP